LKQPNASLRTPKAEREPPVKDDEYLKAASRFSVSYMSNAKWVRLFTAVARSGIKVDRAQWNMIEDDHAFWNRMPRESDLLPSRFQDGAFQPFEYKWIRSIFIPREYRPYPGIGYTRNQDVEGVRAAIEENGAFPLEDQGEGLLIKGYDP
jgi:hypothetical protein